MTRAQLMTLLAAQYPELQAYEIEGIVMVFFDTIVERLADGGRVEIRRFGSFSTRERVARTGRNPLTGEQVQVNAKRSLHFTPGKNLRKLVADSKV